jgi:predicted RNA-binding protein YlqC (UPF0109 family)
MKELVEHLARALVEHPEDVMVEQKDNGESFLLELRVSPDDMGKVIGKHGRIAKAIRTIVKAAVSQGNDKKVIVDICGGDGS